MDIFWRWKKHNTNHTELFTYPLSGLSFWLCGIIWPFLQRFLRIQLNVATTGEVNLLHAPITAYCVGGLKHSNIVLEHFTCSMVLRALIWGWWPATCSTACIVNIYIFCTLYCSPLFLKKSHTAKLLLSIKSHWKKWLLKRQICSCINEFFDGIFISVVVFSMETQAQISR